MKKILYILTFFMLLASASFAQDDADKAAKIRERMQEYLQNRLDLSKAEAERFGPTFLNYFNDLRKTTQEFRGDRLVQQQKVAELRLRYRDQFKTIMGDQKSNDLFRYEHDFVEEVHKIRQERMDKLMDRGNKRLGNQLP
jgi:hypothetical protein